MSGFVWKRALVSRNLSQDIYALTVTYIANDCDTLSDKADCQPPAGYWPL